MKVGIREHKQHIGAQGCGCDMQVKVIIPGFFLEHYFELSLLVLNDNRKKQNRRVIIDGLRSVPGQVIIQANGSFSERETPVHVSFLEMNKHKYCTVKLTTEYKCEISPL